MRKINMKNTLDYFKEICAIPHGSYNIDAISDHLTDFAKEHGLSYRQDDLKNVIIRKPASEGYENEPGIIIQGHMDMVAVKDEGVEIDLEKEGLRLEEKDGYLFAKGTSLGGDDGIALAYSLRILADDTLKHPELECVFTVNEEVGMEGAIGLDMSDIKGRYLLNVDSEEEGIITTSCAGGVTLNSLLECSCDTESYGDTYLLEIKNLKGGHSGTSIHEGRSNACILAGRLLDSIIKKGKTDLIGISGGEKENAIPASSSMIICTEICSEDFSDVINDFDKTVNEEYEGIEDEIVISVTPLSNTEGVKCIDKTGIIAKALTEVPDGVIKMCENIDMVETSLNLGVMRLDEQGFKLTFCIRSSIAKEKDDLKEKVGTILAKKGFKLALSGDYPGWEFNPESMLTKRCVECYRKVYSKEPEVLGVHAGLECGILMEKKKNLDCVSIGPNILNIHTTGEKLALDSVERTERLILEIIAYKEN
ncbi:MAG: beta-Ala-His dipeptidase [Lachnospiraceae bacterium]|nr:beta-Ala-His dipeptidase [Lachnospiraceae bacterium]